MILVTGGAGFIGTHTCAALADAGIPTLQLDKVDTLDDTATGHVKAGNDAFGKHGLSL